MLLIVVAGAACGPRSRPLEQAYREGRAELAAGHLELARATAEDGLRQAQRAGEAGWVRSFGVLEAEVLVAQRRTEEALLRLAPILAAGGQADAVGARALMTRGFARCLSRDPGEAPGAAEPDLEEASRLAAALGSAEVAAEVTLRRGTCALLRNDHAAAETLFRETLELARRQRFALIEAQAAGSLGNLRVRTSRFDDAVRWLRRSLAAVEGLPADGLRAKSLGNLGWCYYRLGDYERAIGVLSEAEALAHRLGSSGDRTIALTNIGRSLYEQGDYEGAQATYSRAAATAQQIHNRVEADTLLAHVQATRAALALERGRYDEAASLAEEVLRIQLQHGDEQGRLRTLLLQGETWARRHDPARATALYRQVIATPGAGSELQWEARVAMARLHVRTGRHAEAEAEFRAAFELMEASLGQLLELEHRLPFFSSLRRFYNDYVDFLVASGNVVEALRVADRSRARFLRERLGMTEPEAGRAPDYPRLARQLGAVVLFYWTAPDRSFLWSITDRGVVLWTLPGEDDLRSLVIDYESRILQSRDPVAEATPAGFALYDVLVAPVAAEIPAGARVVVVPDGPLHRLSFETLLVPGREPRYWIEDVILAATPSLHLLDAVALDAVAFDAVPLDAVPRRARDGAPSVLILGDPIPAGDGLPALPFARREIAGIASLFAPERRMVVAGQAAEPAAYRRADPARFTFIHFAAHAEANREVPLDSALLLSPGEDRHKLYAHDIVEIPLHSELVTISACRGAGSRAYSAEGLVGLAWAFLGSGAGHVIGGLWDVEDASTAELMEHLYRELVAGTDPATALRRAKLRLLASETAYRKPYYWAPFVTYTSRRPPRAR